MIKAKVNTREFQAALRAAIIESSRSAREVVNGQALALASRTIRLTEKANANRIEYILGRIGTGIKRLKSGRYRLTKSGKIAGRFALYKKDSFAERIIRKRRRDAKKKPLNEAEMKVAVKKLIAARKRSTGFLSFGWKWSIADLANKVGYRDRRGQTKQRRPRGKRMGYALTRGTEAKPAVIIVNTSLNPKHNRGNPEPVVLRGLQRGINETVRDIRRHLEKKLQQRLKRYNGR